MSEHYPQFHTFLSENVVTPFYLRRLEGLQAIRLQAVLKRKNPYLFKAKNIEKTGDLAQSVVDAFLSSQEETLFGDLMESFAIYVASTLWNGHKSKRVGLDLEFEREGKYYIVEIKSGVNWGNSSQIKRMKENFAVARIALNKEMDKEGFLLPSTVAFMAKMRAHSKLMWTMPTKLISNMQAKSFGTFYRATTICSAKL